MGTYWQDQRRKEEQRKVKEFDAWKSWKAAQEPPTFGMASQGSVRVPRASVLPTPLAVFNYPMFAMPVQTGGPDEATWAYCKVVGPNEVWDYYRDGRVQNASAYGSAVTFRMIASLVTAGTWAWCTESAGQARVNPVVSAAAPPVAAAPTAIATKYPVYYVCDSGSPAYAYRVRTDDIWYERVDRLSKNKTSFEWTKSCDELVAAGHWWAVDEATALARVKP